MASRYGKTRPHGSPPAAWDEEEPTVVWTPEWVDEATTAPVAAVADEPGAAEPLRSEPRPDVEVSIHKVPAQRAKTRPVVYEIWTKNRIYNLDSHLRCVEVIDLATGAPNGRHPFIGARLVGGQLQTEKDTELSYPLPSPGADAVFQKSDQQNRIALSTTSRVTRVILHVQRAVVPQAQRDGAWSRITSH